MKAFVTSIGESTTDLCVWSLKRNGFDVTLIKDDTSLAHKLDVIYSLADEDFLRVDADVVVNRNCKPEVIPHTCPKDKWWVQYMCFGWFSQDLIHGGVQYIKKEAVPILRSNIHKAKDKERPESFMFRLEEFHNPRKCITNSMVMGIHGYGQIDIDRVKETKNRRGQMANYDFELAERLNQL